jgi:RimJ/RimL family protein N-acetyltransferase
MKVVAYPTAAEFWQVAGPLFTADPVRNTATMTVLSRLLVGGRFGDEQPVFLTVHDTGDGADLIGAALCTPPFPISVSAVPPRAAGVVAGYLLDTGFRPSGASGLQPEVGEFVSVWCRRAGADVADRMAQRLYRLSELKPPPGVPGEVVEGGDADVDLLADWYAGFSRDALTHGRGHWTHADLVQQVRDRADAGNGHLIWRVDGEPVSLAVASASQHGTSRIGPVYTPKELRGRGYASAVTAAASQRCLDQGAEHVVLFTDLANPVSNAIYQRIGFVPVADALDVVFTGPGYRGR